MRATRLAIWFAAAILGFAPASLAQLLDPATLAKYVDLLPNPLDNVIAPSGSVDGATYYEVSISQFAQKLHRDLNPTPLWGYNGAYPGPTFVVNRDEKVKVKWTNNLVDGQGVPLEHLLPYDTTVHGAHDHFPQARVVIHLHGGIDDALSDGYPEHWFSADPTAAPNGMGGPAGNNLTTTYPNNQRSTTMWYHDHAVGITRLNIYGGLAGFYLLRDSEEQALNLPSGEYDIPLMIQDRSFYQDGRLFYPAGPGDLVAPGAGDPLMGLPDNFPSDSSIVPHFFGNTNLVNGAVWPLVEVEARKYRLRLLNGANSRFYNLKMDASGEMLPFHQIGTDNGLLESRVQRNEVLLGPADRADVVVDFSNLSVGEEILLRNTAPDGPFGLDGTTPADPNTTGQVMKFRIIGPQGNDQSSLPDSLSTIERLDKNAATVVRHLELLDHHDEFGRHKMLLDGKHWTDPISEIPRLGDVEIWEFANFTRDAHPMHIHQGTFQLLERESRQGGLLPIEPYETGWEDTIVVNPRETVRVILRFDQFAGEFVWHCHLLEHEDHEMMRPFEVIPEPGAGRLLLISTSFVLAWVSGKVRRRTRARRSTN